MQLIRVTNQNFYTVQKTSVNKIKVTDSADDYSKIDKYILDDDVNEVDKWLID